MKTLITCCLGAILLAGCGGSLSDAEKATAGHALTSLSTDGQGQTSRRAALEYYRELRSRATGCAPQSQTSGSLTYTVTCPDGNGVDSYKIVMTSSDSLSRTCGTDTFTVQALTATFTFKTTNNTIAISGDINASVNANPLVCKYSVSITSGNATVADDGFSCSYKGVDLDKNELTAYTCTTR